MLFHRIDTQGLKITRELIGEQFVVRSWYGMDRIEGAEQVLVWITSELPAPPLGTIFHLMDLDMKSFAPGDITPDEREFLSIQTFYGYKLDDEDTIFILLIDEDTAEMGLMGFDDKYLENL